MIGKIIKLPVIQDPTEAFSQLRLEALGFKNSEDLESVDINNTGWGVSAEENIRKWQTTCR